MNDTASAEARILETGRVSPIEPVPYRPPLGLLAEARARGLAPSFFWQDQFETHIGLGEVDRIETEGPDRLERLDEALAERLAHDPELAGERWFGGFSFEPTVEGSFELFGSARFFRARYLWSLDRVRGQAYLTVGGAGSRRERERVIDWAHARVAEPQPFSGEALVQEGSFEAWARSMDRARTAFDRKEVRKVVLSRDIEVTRPKPIDPARVLAGLPARSSSEAAFAFFGGPACFLGLTPECLIRVEHGRLRTEALAGSSAPDDPEGRALLQSEKDLEEHAYVVLHLRERLADLAEVVEVPEGPSLRRLGHLAHLCTSIEARGLKVRSILSAADALHPTPAVGGVPVDAANAVISEAEGRLRGWYAGAVGWIEPALDGPGRGELRVALRSALLSNEKAKVFVGAGIVPASTVEGEWKETAVKASRMLAALGDS